MFFFAGIVHDEQICCKLVATSVQRQSWIKLGRCSSAAPSQAWACHGRQGQAGKGQHQPEWGCSTSCSNLILLPPPSHRWRHLISSFIFTVLRRELFFTNPNWNQGTFSQGFPMNHCCKALEAKFALQRLEPDSATEAAFIKANVHQICLLSIFAVLLFFILFFFWFED